MPSQTGVPGLEITLFRTLAAEELGLSDVDRLDVRDRQLVVDSVVHQLRKQLRRRAERLETVRGVGYRLTD
jgi:DNA-binding response OmpR family regulator